MRLNIYSAVLVLRLASAALPPVPPPTPILTFSGAVLLPNVADYIGTGKVDHLEGTAAGLLFLSVKENNTVAVVDMRRRAFVTSLPVPAPQGVGKDMNAGQ